MDYKFEYFEKFNKMPLSYRNLNEKSEFYQEILKECIENNKELTFEKLDEKLKFENSNFYLI